MKIINTRTGATYRSRTLKPMGGIFYDKEENRAFYTAEWKRVPSIWQRIINLFKMR